MKVLHLLRGDEDLLFFAQCGFVLKCTADFEDWGVRRVAMASLAAAAPRGCEGALVALQVPGQLCLQTVLQEIRTAGTGVGSWVLQPWSSLVKLSMDIDVSVTWAWPRSYLHRYGSSYFGVCSDSNVQRCLT